jgi:integrase
MSTKPCVEVSSKLNLVVLPAPHANLPVASSDSTRRRKSMSRRIGQDGTIEVRNGAYRGRWLEDVPGQVDRVRRSVVLGFVREMTRTQARRKLRDIIAAQGVNSPSYVIPSADSVAKRIAWWEENYLSRQKPSTQRTMAYHVRKYLLPKWGKTPVDFVTSEKVNEWLGELQHLSPMSMKHIVATLCLILGRRFGRKVIHYPSQVEAQVDAVCYTPDQMSKIVADAKGMYRVLFATAAETGMRSGELYALEVPDIDFARCIIHVRRSVWEGVKQSPKSRNAYRAIDVKPSVIELLKEHVNGRTEGSLFSSRNGRPLRNTNVLRRQLHPVLQKLGIPVGGMHGFRHGRVSFLVENNAPVEVIKAWIGHGSEAMIRRYTHLRPQYRRNVLDAIPAAFGNQTSAIVPS